MNSDNSSSIERTERTVRPQQMQHEPMPKEEEVQLHAPLMQQQQAKGVACPACGAMNDAEAMFCAQCGQPLGKGLCPHCGAEIDPDADFCEVCRHYIRKDVCSYCGAGLSGNEAYCPECGSPRGGLVCPTCHSLNDFAFCKKCGTALTEEARGLVKQLQMDVDYQQLVNAMQEYSALENVLPYNSEHDVEREQLNIQLRQRVLALLAEDAGVELPEVPPSETKRMTREQLDKKKSEKVKVLSAILEKLAVPPMASPVKARNMAMASKPIGLRLAWVCNYKGAMHSSPCGCAKPHLGGKWVILGKNSAAEIKDDE